MGGVHIHIFGGYIFVWSCFDLCRNQGASPPPRTHTIKAQATPLINDIQCEKGLSTSGGFSRRVHRGAHACWFGSPPSTNLCCHVALTLKTGK